VEALSGFPRHETAKPSSVVLSALRASVQSGRRGRRLVAYLLKIVMTLPVSRHAAITSLALAIAAPSAFADSVAQTTLTPVIVTATRTPQLANDILADHISIGPEEIANAGPVSLSDLLQRQRGIEVVRNGGPGASSSVLIRGANKQQNIVLVDGVRIGSSTSGEANWSAIPLSAIEHIEVVYGPLSTLYGADAIGGVIQIFTKKGTGAPRLSASVGAGSDETRTYDAGVAGATGGAHSLSYALSVGKEKSDGFSAIKSNNPDNDGYYKESANGQFALQLAKGHEVGLLFLQSRLDSKNDGGSSTYDARSLQKLQNVALVTKNAFLSNWNSQVQIAQARDKTRSDTSPTGKTMFNTTQTDIIWQNDIRIGADDTLQLLFDHRKEEAFSKVNSTDIGKTRNRTTNSAAASYNLKQERHLASISLRNDDSSQYGSKTTGGLGYGYRISRALRTNASVGTSFRAPTFNELYDPRYGVDDNRPEKGRNKEVGLHFDNGSLQWGAVYYRNRVTDLLVTKKPCPLNLPQYVTFGCAQNVDSALLEGLSLSARKQIGDFNISGNIDWQDPHDEKTGNTLARRSKKHANLAAEYNAGALTGGAELQLSGKRFDDAKNTLALGGYGLLNLFATYQIAPDWSLLARWNNVTDKNYELARTYATAGSNVFVGLRYAMK
jgi:vitamin B12 transporter